MVVYPRTGHDPQDPKLLLDIMKRNVAWFDKHLRAATPQRSRTKPPSGAGPRK
jgi:hypothetical protein